MLSASPFMFDAQTPKPEWPVTEPALMVSAPFPKFVAEMPSSPPETPVPENASSRPVPAMISSRVVPLALSARMAVIVFGAHSARLAGDITSDMHNECAATHVRGVYPVVSAARDVACAYRQVARSAAECTDAVISAVDRAADKARSGAGADDDCDGIRARREYPVLARGRRTDDALRDVDVETTAVRVSSRGCRIRPRR